jgi:hypothetical protein
MALLEEANRINNQDILTWQEIESHVQMITRSNLRQQIKKPQQVQVVVSPTPLPGPSHQPDNSHWATCGRNYARQQYQCFQCGNPTHFKWDCPLYTCQTCDQVAPGHTPWACQGRVYDDGLHGHFDIEGEYNGNLMRKCWDTHDTFNFLFKKFSLSLFLTRHFSIPFIMSSLAFTKTFKFVPLPSIVESIITPSFNNFYSLPIPTKHHTWYLHNTDLFISIHGILYSIHQWWLEESILFQEVLWHGQDHRIRIVPFHPIPFNILKREIFNQFLILLYCGTTALNHLSRNDWVNIKWLCIDWYLPHQTAMIILLWLWY